jgi:hypothetical protein
MKLATSKSPRNSGSFIDFGKEEQSLRNSRTSFSAKVGSVKISVPSLRRSRKVRIIPFIGRGMLYGTGIFLLLWGIYTSWVLLLRRDAGLDILNSLIAIFGGCLFIFLANHDRAVCRKTRDGNNQ